MARPISPFLTDSVSRGNCISLFTLEIISLAISIRLFFFITNPLIERLVKWSVLSRRRKAVSAEVKISNLVLNIDN